MGDAALLTALIFLAGAFAGHGAAATGRLLRVSADRALRVGTALSLAMTLSGSVAVVVRGVRFLARCGSDGTGCAPRRHTLITVATLLPHGPRLDLELQLDALAAVFLVMIALLAGLIAVYSWGWLRADPLAGWVSGSLNLFVLAMLASVAVGVGLWMIIALELMTVFSADLVRYQGRRGGDIAESITAVRTYLVVNQLGLLCLLLGLLPALVTPGNRVLGGTARSASIALVLIGLGARCGLAPFHFWVPVVHPHLPTNTHALMSAAMLKIPIYLMIRILFGQVLGPVPRWWGAVVLVIAGATGLICVAYAMVSHDLKTALAYHSVENVGIIMIGVGAALLFGGASEPSGVHPPGAAVLALVAGLYHVVNHSLFKSLLFLGTGAVERLTGTVTLSQLGGILRSAPRIGWPFLVGALAISGLPPLNGFVSEWLTFQALFGGAALHEQTVSALPELTAVTVAVTTLAMTLAPTATAFLKMAGDCLLGPTRRPGDPAARAWSVELMPCLLALGCILLGLQPWLLVGWLHAAAVGVVSEPGTRSVTGDPASLQVAVAGYSAHLPTLPLLMLWLVPAGLWLILTPTRWTRRPVWVGGTAFDGRRMQYTGSAFAAQVWDPIAGEPGAARSGVLPTAVAVARRRVVTEQANRLVNVVVRSVERASEWFGGRAQSGDVGQYLLYIAVAVMVALVTAILYPTGGVP